MNALEQMQHRRSVRSFQADLPSRELIEQIVAAGTFAPSGKGNQSGLIIAVTNREVRDRLSALNARILGRDDGFDPFYGAPVVLVVLAKKESPHRLYDGSLIMGNLLLAADAVGLGACWIHRAKEAFEAEEGKALLKQLGIQEEYEGIGHCVLGYPDGTYPSAKPRKENYVYFVE